MSDFVGKGTTYDPDSLIAGRFRSGPDLGRVVSANEREILRIVRDNHRISRSEITDRTNLTQQSVHRLVDNLASRGAIRLGEPIPGTGRGQPSPTVVLNRGFAVSVGISVNTDTISVCLFDFAGKIRATEHLPIADRPLGYGLEQIGMSVRQQFAQNEIEYETLFGAGFAISGFLESGTIYNTPLPLHEWSLVELGPTVSEVLGCPVWTANSANTAAVCESILGIGRYIRNFVYLSIDYGFGGALIVDGDLMRGGHGNAGELSAMFELEEMNNRPALESLLANLVSNGVRVTTVDDIRRNFDPAWPGVESWIDRVAPVLNRTVNAIYAIADPQAIIFGGQIPKQLADRLISRVEFVRLPRHGRLMKAPKLFSTDLDVDASAVGAAVMPFKSVFF